MSGDQELSPFRKITVLSISVHVAAAGITPPPSYEAPAAAPNITSYNAGSNAIAWQVHSLH
jgi:hypothetical protein